MRELFQQFCSGLAVLTVLFSSRPVLADDPLPTPLTREFTDGMTFAIPQVADVEPYRLRTIEPDDLESARCGLRCLFSVFDPWFRSGRNAAEVAPLVRPDAGWVSRGASVRGRDTVELLPVKALSIPNPFALLGSPTQWGGRFRAAYGSNFNDGSLLHGNLIIDRGLPLGIDSEFNYRTDPRRVLADRRFWNGDLNVVYHLKQIRYVGFRLGIGANWLTDGAHTDVGFNTTYGFDIRLKKPFYATTTIDYGWLGSKQMLHWHLSGGLDFGRFELFIGYDFFEVGSRERKNVIAGAGIWW